MSEQIHLDSEEEVLGLCYLMLEGHEAAVGVVIFCDEITLLVSAGDGQLNAIAHKDMGGAHAENVGGDRDVGGEG